MTTQNTLDDLVITHGSEVLNISLSHLEDLTINIPEFRFENNLVKAVTIYVRPTNHVYSRRFDESIDNWSHLNTTGELLLRYDHQEGMPHSPLLNSNGQPNLSSDMRVFCPEKYNYSKLLPVFVELLNSRTATICIRPHAEDERKCLSALMSLPEPYPDNERCIFLFKLHKYSSCEINMVIETAFVVSEEDWRVVLLEKKENQKRFISLLVNIFQRRKPFEGKSKKSSKKSMKLKKRKLKQQRLQNSNN